MLSVCRSECLRGAVSADKVQNCPFSVQVEWLLQCRQRFLVAMAACAGQFKLTMHDDKAL